MWSSPRSGRNAFLPGKGRLYKVEDRQARGFDARGHLWSLLLRDNQVLGPSERLFQAAVEQLADVGDDLQNEAPVRAVDGVQLDMRVEHANVAALADQLLEHGHHRALAQVIRVFLEGQADYADAC